MVLMPQAPSAVGTQAHDAVGPMAWLGRELGKGQGLRAGMSLNTCCENSNECSSPSFIEKMNH